jgi:hypothetical protein
MTTTLRRLAARLAVVLLVTVGTGASLTGTASAAPYDCYKGVSGPSSAGSYGAYAKCWSGSGYYRVGATCPYSGSVMSIYGPWVKRVTNSPLSWAYCPAGAKPLVVYVQTKNL